MAVVNMEATELSVSSGKVEAIFTKLHGNHNDLVNRCGMYITDEYVPFFVV